ncbi:hypothetical protein BJ875DRAFT_485844 [Amylocarpus encephaloides]|uniref:Uncharacterized protein n=1 Tax=Amylocarpus encephaloides TaxID=45428 RepID=A0A9P8C3M6_9HELO|nr:hypothetical protein BJ875DRAFT_485844 [Amylocarpus encephaloides]
MDFSMYEFSARFSLQQKQSPSGTPRSSDNVAQSQDTTQVGEASSSKPVPEDIFDFSKLSLPKLVVRATNEETVRGCLRDFPHIPPSFYETDEWKEMQPQIAEYDAQITDLDAKIAVIQAANAARAADYRKSILHKSLLVGMIRIRRLAFSPDDPRISWFIEREEAQREEIEDIIHSKWKWGHDDYKEFKEMKDLAIRLVVEDPSSYPEDREELLQKHRDLLLD